MNEFLKNWKNDSKFRAKVQLSAYGIFAIIVLIYGFINSRVTPNNENLSNTYDDLQKVSITVPEKYNYTIDININGKNHRYEGTKTNIKENIVKISDEKSYNYTKQEGKFYKGAVMPNQETTKEEVYDIIDYNYLNLDVINKYLSLSKKDGNGRIVYLKDIIIGNDSDKYIVIKATNNEINIDYTALIQIFDTSIENCNVEYVIEEIE